MKAAEALDIAIVDDEAVIRDVLRDFLVRRGDRVREYGDGMAAAAAFAANPPDVALLDIRMPGDDGLAVLGRLRERHPELPVVMMSGHGTMDSAIEALRLGASDFLRKPVRLPDLVTALDRIVRLRQIERSRQRHAPAAPSAPTYIGSGPACREVQAFLKAAERTPFDSVLVTGETGSGKEVIARELHRRLRGAEAPFVAVNCPALPENLVESEIFGHMKGAFTGADADKPGAFELADGGTLFLDELGDLAPAAQAKLLRALETRTVRRVGGRRDQAVAVTVIAATNQDLDAMVASGRFRSDLLYRLNTFQVRLPPLRERPEDIPSLAAHFAAQSAARRGIPPPRLGAAALAALVAHRFPGNVRELRNLIERAVMLCDGPDIDPAVLGLRPTSPPPVAAPVVPPAPAAGDAERCETLAILDKHRWNRRQAARALGITYEALRWRIEKHGLGR